jgi:simple sugar transport system permease protein
MPESDTTGVVDPAEVTEEPTEHAEIVIDRVSRRRGLVAGLVCAGLGIAVAVLFGRSSGADASFVLNARGDDTLPDLVFPSRAGVLVVAAVGIVVGVVGASRAKGRVAPLLIATGFVVFAVGMLVWATADNTVTIVGLANGTIARGAPLALGALAGVLCERAGVVNIAIEGMLLGAAFTGAIVASLAGNLWIGVLGGVVAGVALAAVLCVLAIRYTVDQVVAGTFVNIFALGATSYLASRITDSTLLEPGTVRPLQLPFLSDIPLVGPVLFDSPPHVYLMFLLTFAIAFGLYRTRWGLRLRAVGEKPEAADAVGIRVNALRWRAVLLGGAVAGLGGTYFTLASAGRFEPNMTAGRGFIALAALIFGRWHPVGALCAALVFGFAEEFQSRIAGIQPDIPSQLLLMLPYLVTLVVVAGLVGRARPPAADGVPFRR